MADRKGPHFQTNLIWAQRYLQISIALPEEPGGQCSARLVPVEFLHCPLPVKPCVQASQQEVDCYKQQCKEAALANKAGRAMQAVRRSIDNQGHAGSEGATAFSHG